MKDELLSGRLDLLYVAPERLMMSSMLSLLDRVNVSLFAIDEAHCVSVWDMTSVPSTESWSC